jgi:hypothetical protein
VLDEDRKTTTGSGRGVWHDLPAAHPSHGWPPPLGDPPPYPPLVTFRAGGVTFWHATIPPDERVTLDGSIRRLFILRTRDQGDRRCFVDMSPAVRRRVAAEWGRDVPAEEPLWDMLCRSALTETLCRHGLLPEAVAIGDLGGRQLEIVRRARAQRGDERGPAQSTSEHSLSRPYPEQE